MVMAHHSPYSQSPCLPPLPHTSDAGLHQTPWRLSCAWVSGNVLPDTHRRNLKECIWSVPSSPGHRTWTSSAQTKCWTDARPDCSWWYPGIPSTYRVVIYPFLFFRDYVAFKFFLKYEKRMQMYVLYQSEPNQPSDAPTEAFLSQSVEKQTMRKLLRQLLLFTPPFLDTSCW